MKPAALALLLALAPAAASAGQSACPDQFLAGSAPDLLKPKLAQRSAELCYAGFAVLHSGLTRTPLWSAEHLTRERVANAREMERVNLFHADDRLPAADRAELDDYVRSGFDRGHMAPSGDMPDATSQAESFTLGNMVPQNPVNNRNLWADIEGAVRNLAKREGEVYVVTGPVFEGAQLSSLRGRVIVPTSIYKAIYVPGTGLAGAYVSRNDASGEWHAVSLDGLRALVGIDVFPAAPAAARAAAGPLPQPAQRRPSHRIEAEAGAGGAAPAEAPARQEAPASLGARMLKDMIRRLP